MDPVAAIANAIQAIAVMVTEIVKGQTVEQKAKIWDWYIQDIQWWRNLLAGVKKSP